MFTSIERTLLWRLCHDPCRCVGDSTDGSRNGAGWESGESDLVRSKDLLWSPGAWRLLATRFEACGCLRGAGCGYILDHERSTFSSFSLLPLDPVSDPLPTSMLIPESARDLPGNPVKSSLSFEKCGMPPPTLRCRSVAILACRENLSSASLSLFCLIFTVQNHAAAVRIRMRRTPRAMAEPRSMRLSGCEKPGDEGASVGSPVAGVV